MSFCSYYFLFFVFSFLRKKDRKKKVVFKRRLALFISIFLVLLTILLVKTYRPYIYKNHIYDFHLADTITSWICIPAASFFSWGISRVKFSKCLIGCLVGFSLYEFIGLTFDWYDIIALFLSSGIAYLIYIFYKRRRSS